MAEDLNLDELKRRLKEGDYLEISTGGGAYEVWAEPLANPPAVYFEGEQHPIAELDGIAQRIMDDMHRGEIRCRWVEDDQKHCRLRLAIENQDQNRRLG